MKIEEGWVEIKDREDEYLEEDIYTENGRDELVEEDELSVMEAGFMEGYEES